MTGGDNFHGGPGAIIVAFALLVVTGSDATAQDRVELSEYGVVGDVRLDAAQTLKAASDTSHARVFGGGVQVTKLWTQPLGIPLEVRTLYVDVAAGWRQVRGRLFAPQRDSVADSGRGRRLLVGFDVAVFGRVRVGGELRYRRIGGVVGSGEASASVDDDSAGGVSAAIRVSIGRW